jgi:hypothetical protein
MSRLRRTTSSVLLAPLCLGLLTSYAVAPASARPETTVAVAADPTPAPPAESTNAAEEALDVAVEVLTQVPGKALEAPGLAALDEIEPTAALLELRSQLDDLDRADRRAAERLFARPDDTTGLDGAARYTAAERAELTEQCTTRYCVHYVPAGAVPGSTASATQAQVDETIAAMERIYSVEIDQLGYHSPVSDGMAGNPSGLLGPTGPPGLLDVYLADTGRIGAYGYAVPEDPNPAHVVSPAYLVLDNDYAGFTSTGTSPTGLRQVTAAHEFFHVVQFAYDSWDDPWLMESTATWMEERVYDDVNDSRQYLGHGPLRQPWIPLDLFQDGGLAHYGGWAFHEMYAEALGADTVRRVWDYAATPGANPRAVVNAALAERGWNLTHAYRMFSAGQLAPALTWSEGAAFPAAHVTRSWRLSGAVRSTGWRGPRLNHLAGLVYNFNPAPRLTGRWKLRVQVDAPNVGGTAYVAVHYTNGAIQRLPIGLRADGTGRVNVPFSSRTVRKVALHVGNTTGTDGRLTRFRATAWR